MVEFSNIEKVSVLHNRLKNLEFVRKSIRKEPNVYKIEAHREIRPDYLQNEGEVKIDMRDFCEFLSAQELKIYSELKELGVKI